MKKGVSTIIATILLVLISISAIIMLYEFVVPFVKNTLAKSEECFKTLEQLKIDTESEYTCYNKDASEKIEVKAKIKRGEKEAEIEGFKISIFDGENAEVFDIKNGQVYNVKMLDGSATIEVPNLGEERTYVITTDLTGEIVEIEIAPITKSGQVCKTTDKAEIKECPQ